MSYKYQTFADLLYASYSRLRFRFGTLNEKRAVYVKSALSNLSEAEEGIVALIHSMPFGVRATLRLECVER